MTITDRKTQLNAYRDASTILLDLTAARRRANGDFAELFEAAEKAAEALVDGIEKEVWKRADPK